MEDMSTAVRQILTQIEALSSTDRETLERNLLRRVESEWRKAQVVATRDARRRGIDEAEIVKAIARSRRR